jgi:hypothetical protein
MVKCKELWTVRTQDPWKDKVQWLNGGCSLITYLRYSGHIEIQRWYVPGAKETLL